VPVWEADHRIKTLAGLPSIFPPTDYRWRKTSKGKTIEKPVAIIHRTCYFGFREGQVAEDYQTMIKVSDFFNFGLRVLGIEVGKPYALTSEDIARLKLLDKEGSKRALTLVHKSIRPGDAVKVSADYKSGALSDISAVLVGFDGDTAEIDALMLGAPRTMSVPAWAVEKA
jgi:hypothetical protein